ncbi:MAG: NUDIX hydrolase [Patescibacteria group bacterium]
MRSIRDKIVFDGTYIQVIERRFRNRVGGAGRWELVRRKTHGRIVAIVPVTPKREVILTKIYRVPMEKWVIEFCAGLADKRGESEISLARRECLEETGYRVGRVRRIMSGPFNAGLLADEMSVFLGMNAVLAQEQQLEDSEAIEVLKVPVKKLRHFLTHPPRDTVVDIKLFCLLPIVERLK